MSSLAAVSSQMCWSSRTWCWWATWVWRSCRTDVRSCRVCTRRCTRPALWSPYSALYSMWADPWRYTSQWWHPGGWSHTGEHGTPTNTQPQYYHLCIWTTYQQLSLSLLLPVIKILNNSVIWCFLTKFQKDSKGNVALSLKYNFNRYLYTNV